MNARRSTWRFGQRDWNPYYVCIVVAARNEQWSIQEVVRLAQEYGTVLVVDNASTDRTVEIAKASYAHVLEHKVDTHIKQSYVDGFRWALQGRFARIVQLDAGMSFHPAQIPDLLDQKADLVIGQRRARDRKLVSVLGSWFTRTMLGLPFPDLTSGFRCWTASGLDCLETRGVLDNLQCRAHGFQIELLYHAYRGGLKIETVPVNYYPGRTSANPSVAWEALRASFRLLAQDFREWRRP